MRRYHGGETVRVGFYWNKTTWSIVPIDRGGGVLPGESNARYLRLPFLLVILLAPLLGAAYVIFLPFIAIAMVLGLGATKLVMVGARAMKGLLARAEEAEVR